MPIRIKTYMNGILAREQSLENFLHDKEADSAMFCTQVLLRILDRAYDSGLFDQKDFKELMSLLRIHEASDVEFVLDETTTTDIENEASSKTS